jgi:hypothetical protein
MYRLVWSIYYCAVRGRGRRVSRGGARVDRAKTTQAKSGRFPRSRGLKFLGSNSTTNRRVVRTRKEGPAPPRSPSDGRTDGHEEVLSAQSTGMDTPDRPPASRAEVTPSPLPPNLTTPAVVPVVSPAQRREGGLIRLLPSTVRSCHVRASPASSRGRGNHRFRRVLVPASETPFSSASWCVSSFFFPPGEPKLGRFVARPALERRGAGFTARPPARAGFLPSVTISHAGASAGSHTARARSGLLLLRLACGAGFRLRGSCRPHHRFFPFDSTDGNQAGAATDPCTSVCQVPEPRHGQIRAGFAPDFVLTQLCPVLLQRVPCAHGCGIYI